MTNLAPNQSIQYPLLGEFGIAVPAFTILIQGAPALGNGFHPVSVGFLIANGFDSFAKYGGVPIK